MGRRPRRRVGGRPRARRLPAHVEAVAAEVVASAAGSPGSRSRTTTPTTPRPCRRCASGSGGRRRSRARGARSSCRSPTASAPARSRRSRRPATAPDHLDVRRRRASPSPATPCSARAASSSRPTRARSPATSPGWSGCASARSALICPGHGPLVEDPDAKLDEYLAHRLARERALLDALAAGARSSTSCWTAPGPTRPPLLRPAATVTLAAHLDKLADEGRLPDGRRAACAAAVVAVIWRRMICVIETQPIISLTTAPRAA